jgi:hypothetical protein
MLCSMKSIFLVAITPFFIGSLFAQQPRARAPSIPTVETKWPGVNFAIYLATGRYNPRPFSLASSVMTDEQTQKKYSVLPPMVPPGKAYFPGELANGLRPGQAETLTIQFVAPPPPDEGSSSKQTVSFSLPGAKGPIANVPVPQPVVEK